MKSWSQRLLLALGLFAAGSAGLRAARSLRDWTTVYDHVSGSWTTLAVDLAHGVLYRPLASELGFGGTRYFPLHVVVQGALIKGGMSAIFAGYAIVFAALLLFFGGAFRLLRRLGASPAWAMAGAGLAFANYPVQLAATRIAGDLLPASLALWALSLLAAPEGERRSHRDVAFAGALFGLSFLGKQTMVFGLIASLLWFALQRGTRRALLLVGAFAVFAAAGLVATQAASDGRFSSSLAACLSGGASWWSVRSAPRMLLLFFPAGDLALLALAAAAWCTLPAARRELLGLLLPVTAALTATLFTSPGVVENHLLDLDAIAALFLVLQLERGRLPPSFAPAATAAAALAALLSLQRPDSFTWPQREVALATLREAGTEEGPLLSENPWVPLLAGEAPVVLDPFSLRLLALRDPSVEKTVMELLERRAFRAVILKRADNFAAPWGDWYGDVHFWPGFLEKVSQGYELTATHHVDHLGFGWFVFRRRPQR